MFIQKYIVQNNNNNNNRILTLKKWASVNPYIKFQKALINYAETKDIVTILCILNTILGMINKKSHKVLVK